MGGSGGPARSATDRAPAGCSHRAVHAGGRVPSNTPRRAIEAALAQVVLSGDGPMGAGPAPACQQPSFAPALRAGETGRPGRRRQVRGRGWASAPGFRPPLASPALPLEKGFSERGKCGDRESPRGGREQLEGRRRGAGGGSRSQVVTGNFSAAPQEGIWTTRAGNCAPPGLGSHARSLHTRCTYSHCAHTHCTHSLHTHSLRARTLCTHSLRTHSLRAHSLLPHGRHLRAGPVLTRGSCSGGEDVFSGPGPVCARPGPLTGPGIPPSRAGPWPQPWRPVLPSRDLQEARARQG